jgi:DNA-binding NarL/FixJ family response regulator
MCKLLFSNKLRKASLNNDKSKILVIDDDPLIRNNMLKLIKIMLRRFGMDYDIVEGSDGRDLIHLVMDDAENLIKLIFTDENMTSVEGSEAITVIKEIKQRNCIKIISITSLEDENSVKRILKCGADMVLKKPASMATLDEVFKTLLRGDCFT